MAGDSDNAERGESGPGPLGTDPSASDVLRSAIDEAVRDGVSPTRGEILRRSGDRLSPAARRRLLFVSGPRSLEGSPLGDWIEAGELPAETGELLLAANALQQFGRSAAGWGLILEGVRSAHRIVAEDLQAVAEITDEPVDDSSEPLPSYRTVETHLEYVCREVRKVEEVVDSAGMGWSWTTLRLEIPTGSGPKLHYRVLVEALMQAYPEYEGGSGADRDVPNTSEVRKWIGRQLAPFFDRKYVDPASTGDLKHTIANIKRG